jgi:hypothetical protein
MYALAFTLNAKLLGLEYVKELYANDDDFASVYGACEMLRPFFFFFLKKKRTNVSSQWQDY